MPLYDFKCEKGHTFERMVKLAHFEEAQYCDCHARANRLISAPRFSVDNVEYECPVTGKAIRSKREHEENLKRQDCRVLETGETEQSVKARAAADEAFEKQVDDSVEQMIEKLPSDKKERLANELTSGADVSVDRITA
jgi:putative FmdB family regulatory protein